MLIYDQFDNLTTAAVFAVAVANRNEDREIIVSTEPLDEVDPIPFQVSGIIVYVGRLIEDDHGSERQAESELERVAVAVGGRFAGT